MSNDLAGKTIKELIAIHRTCCINTERKPSDDINLLLMQDVEVAIERRCSASQPVAEERVFKILHHNTYSIPLVMGVIKELRDAGLNIAPSEGES